jgi:hypothetical protein
MWKYLPNGWPEEGSLQGWNAQGVLEVYLSGLPKLQRRINHSFPLPFDAPDQTPTDRDYLEQNIYLSYGYVLGLAAHAKDAISILDWGGAVGQYFLLTQALIPDLDLDYHIKDAPISCERRGVKH